MNNGLTEAEFQRIDELMKNGIMTDPGTGKDFFTGYSYKTLYDWDQYFEAISRPEYHV